MIKVLPDKIDAFRKFLYDLENAELPKGMHKDKPKQHYHFIINYLKPTLEIIDESWNLNNAYQLDDGKTYRKGKKIDVWKKLLNEGLVKGQFSENTFNSYICYFLHHFLAEYYKSIVNIDYLNNLITLFEYVEEDNSPKNYILEIEKIIEYILKNHDSFNKTFFKNDDFEIIKSKYTPLSKVKCEIGYGLTISFSVPDPRNTNVYIPLKSIISSDDNDTGNKEGDKSSVDSDITNDDDAQVRMLVMEAIKKRQYWSNLREEFGIIRLAVANFEMPVNNYIKLPLLKSDEFFKEELKTLEDRYEALDIEDEKNKETLTELNSRIKRIQSILLEKHDIHSIISLGKDIFIEAPAGYGKSTLLRYLTYYYARYSGSYIPIFIELMYNINDNLQQFVKASLKETKLNKEEIKQYRILLLLDGFDQFTGNRNKLFEDIKKIKKRYNTHIIFSGRELPNYSNHNLDLVVYNLEPFSQNDILRFCINYLQEDGYTIYKHINKRDTQGDVNKPLFLSFLLAFLKEKIKKGGYDLNEASEVINNKSKLIESIIIDKFIGKYERDRTEVSKEIWKDQKVKELEVIAYLAYVMSFKLKGIEVITKDKALDIFNTYNKKVAVSRRIDGNTIIQNFIEHHIIVFKNGLLSFEKKELRMYFTAKAVIKEIESFKDVLRFRRKYYGIRHRYDNRNYLDPYIIGLADPNKILKELSIVDLNNPIALNRNFIELFKLAIRFIDQQNYPKSLPRINNDFLISIFELILSKFNTSQNNVSGTSTIFSIRYIFSKFFGYGRIFDKYLTQGIENRINHYFFQFQYQFEYPYVINDFVSNITKYDVGISLERLIKIISKINIPAFSNGKFYQQILQQRRVAYSVTRKERAEISHDLVFNPFHSEKYKDLLFDASILSRGKKAAHHFALWHFANYTFSGYTSEIVNVLFDREQVINEFTIKRYLYARNQLHAHTFFFEKGILKEGYHKKLFTLFKRHALEVEIKSNKFFQFEFMINKSTDTLLTDLFCNYFLEVIQSNSINKSKQINAFCYLFAKKRSQDIALINKKFLKKDQGIIDLCLEALQAYYPDKERAVYEHFDSNLISLYAQIFNSNSISEEIAREILLNASYTNEAFNNIVMKLTEVNFNNNLPGYACFFFSKHKVKEAVPLLESLLKGAHNKKAYYSLTKLNPALFYKHQQLFAKRYGEVYDYMKRFKTEYIDKIDVSILEDTFLLGDHNMLRLLSEINVSYGKNMNTDYSVKFRNYKQLLEEKIAHIDTYENPLN